MASATQDEFIVEPPAVRVSTKKQAQEISMLNYQQFIIELCIVSSSFVLKVTYQIIAR